MVKDKSKTNKVRAKKYQRIFSKPISYISTEQTVRYFSDGAFGYLARIKGARKYH